MSKFHWNSEEIERDLCWIDGIQKITNIGPGGDVDSDNFHIVVEDSDDALWVCGFNVDDYRTARSATDVDVDMIQLTDGLDSRGGLNSKNHNTGNVYLAVRQYFIDRQAVVVGNLREYF